MHPQVPTSNPSQLTICVIPATEELPLCVIPATTIPVLLRYERLQESSLRYCGDTKQVQKPRKRNGKPGGSENLSDAPHLCLIITYYVNLDVLQALNLVKLGHYADMKTRLLATHLQRVRVWTQFTRKMQAKCALCTLTTGLA